MLLRALLAAAAVSTAYGLTHMNPTMKYVVSNPAPGHEGESREFATSDYFEVDSPVMDMKYSQIVWTTLPAVDLPKAVVDKYANSTMAVTGFEVDLLRKNPTTGKLESVPAYENYNHHYGVELLSTAVKLKYVVAAFVVVVAAHLCFPGWCFALRLLRSTTS